MIESQSDDDDDDYEDDNDDVGVDGKDEVETSLHAIDPCF